MALCLVKDLGRKNTLIGYAQIIQSLGYHVSHIRLTSFLSKIVGLSQLSIPYLRRDKKGVYNGYLTVPNRTLSASSFAYAPGKESNLA